MHMIHRSELASAQLISGFTSSSAGEPARCSDAIRHLNWQNAVRGKMFAMEYEASRPPS